jgi:hypothetical protein
MVAEWRRIDAANTLSVNLCRCVFRGCVGEFSKSEGVVVVEGERMDVDIWMCASCAVRAYEVGERMFIPPGYVTTSNLRISEGY